MDTCNLVITQEFSGLLTLNPIPALLNGSSHIRKRAYSIFDRDGRNDELRTGASNYFLSQAKEVYMGVLKPGFYTSVYKEANRKITYDSNNGFSLSYVFPSKHLSYFLSEPFKLFCTERWPPLHT